MPPVSVPHPSPSTWTLIGRLLGLSWRYRWACAKLLTLQALLLAATLGSLEVTGLGIDLVRAHAGAGGSATALLGETIVAGWPPMVQILLLAAVLLVLAAARGLLNYAYALAAGHLVHHRIVVDLRSQVYGQLQRLSFRFFDAHATGSIINRVTSDIQAVRSFVDGVLIQFVILGLSLVCYLVTMARIHVPLTAVCLATTPLLWLVTTVFSRLVRPRYDKNRELVDGMVLTLAENIQGVQVVKGFGREAEEIAKFAAANRAVQDQQRGIFWRVSTFTPLIGLLTQLNMILLLAYGGYLVAHHRLALGGGLVVFAGLLQQLATQVSNLTNIANSVQQSLSGARRVFEILDTPVEIHSPPQAVARPHVRGEVRFERVSFAYQPDRLVLKDLDFTVAAGQHVAILGPTGAGKSTLLSLIARFYDPTRGRMLVDGIDLKQLNLDDLRRAIGVVFQESFLFSHTVAANIAFGDPHATRERIERAACIAAAHNFITRLPHDYDTVLGEGGCDLSGGQRQRLAIARAVLLDPPILLLDDPAASIDPHTEHEILIGMQQAMQGRTTFMVAHRLSTLRHADMVLVLDDGRIVQAGTHEELLRREGYYRRTAELQEQVRGLRRVRAAESRGRREGAVTR